MAFQETGNIRRPDVTCGACRLITCKQPELNIPFRIMYVTGPDGDYIWVIREEVGACNVLNEVYPEEVNLVHLGQDHDLNQTDIRNLLHLLIDVMREERVDEKEFVIPLSADPDSNAT